MTETMIGGALKIVCSREELAQKLAVVGRGVSTRTAVQILSGILLRAVGGKLELAATDMELSIRTTLDGQVEGEGAVPELEAIVPARALEELRRLVSPGGTIELGVLENQVVFGVDGTWLTSRRIEGQFPKFDELRPKEFKHEVTLPREELLEVV